MITPYDDKKTSKKEQVREMFDSIAPRYDFLNHFLSAGIDIYWRKKAIRLVGKTMGEKIVGSRILDVATGTGDLAIEALSLQPEKVIGVDIAEQMLELGREKLEKKQLADKIELKQGDSENLPFTDNTFQAVMVAFGVRNFEDLEKGLQEMQRVLNPRGMVAIVEFTHPRLFPLKQLFSVYFRYVLPIIGRIVSGDKNAYTYLPRSVQHFPQREAFLKKLQQAGFQQTTYHSLTFGICTIYTGIKSS